MDAVSNLDALYNPARRRAGVPANYLARRRQLLQRRFSPIAAPAPAPPAPEYLLLRQTLLARQYGAPAVPAPLERRVPLPRPLRPFAAAAGRRSLDTPDVPVAPTDRAATLDGRIVYTHHRQAVTVVRFANTSRSRFACGCADGTASLCVVREDPDMPSTLVGHAKGVTDLQWTADDAFIVTTSLDGTVRLWNTTSGSLVRTMKDTAPVLCCCFNAENNNLLVVGNKHGDLKTYNLSTGKPVNDSAVNIGCAVTAVVFEPLGRLLYAGTDRGEIHVFTFASGHGSFARLYRTTVTVNGPAAVCSLAVVPALSLETHEPCLLVAAKDNTVKLLGIGSFSKKRGAPIAAALPSRLNAVTNRLQYRVTLEAQFALRHQVHNLNAILCPLLSMQKGPCFVSGVEDGTIQLVRAVPGQSLLTLKAHTASVLSVSWNRDESLLASSDLTGMVIVWKRSNFAAAL